MKGIIKKLVLFAVIGGVLYVLLSYHFIFVGHEVRSLKKTSHNLDYIFYSTKGKRAETILAVDPLWKAGIGELLVAEGVMSIDELELYKEKRANEG